MQCFPGSDKCLTGGHYYHCQGRVTRGEYWKWHTDDVPSASFLQGQAFEWKVLCADLSQHYLFLKDAQPDVESVKIEYGHSVL